MNRTGTERAMGTNNGECLIKVRFYILCNIVGPFHIVRLKQSNFFNREVTVHSNTLIEQSQNALQAILVQGPFNTEGI